MCKTLSALIILILLTSTIGSSQKPVKAQYAPGIVVFKLKQQSATTYLNRQLSSEAPETLAEKLKKKAGANTVYQPFGAAKTSKTKNQLLKQGSSTLDGIFKMELPAGVSVEEVIEMLKLQPEVLYAEPYFLPELLTTPNDPLYASQSYLPVIKAPQAWARQKGSRDIIIGILDTGVDFNHPDLKNNLHLNLNDPINGIDDDGDGFIDNYRGWDFANSDNDPTADKHDHGTKVTGVCAASTNNGLGVAGTGYNTRYMPIKIFTSKTNSFANGYEAIAYAANMGCHIINLSWGGASSPSEYVQDIINYAVLEKDVVIVAAAGNTSAELDFFPASYKNVLSVSATDNNDNKASWSTWSRFVDIVAPGVTYTTANGGGYASPQGTSFAAPQVSGAAALIRARFPELNALQVMEVLRMSSDNIYHVGTNINFKNRLGRGRLNMEKAMQGATSPALRMNQFAYSNGIGNYAFHNDTVQMWMDFTNYLNPANGVKVKLVSESAYAIVMEDEVSLGTVNTLQKVSNSAKPFRFRLTSHLPAMATLSFRLEFSTAEGYTDYQYFYFRTSGEYIDFRVNGLTLTIASNGNLGYNYDYNLQGLGLRYQNAALAHNMGLLIAQNPKAIANNMVNTTVPARRNLDFKTIERVRLYSHSQADVDARSSFEVIRADSVRLNLKIDQKILGWNNDVHGAAIVLEYNIINRADTAYNKLHVALFSDFNLNDFFRNRAKWDAGNRLAYAYDEATSRYAGIVLISEQNLLHHALDLNTREGNTAEISTTISRNQKWNFISRGLNKEEAGAKGKGNDVAQFLGGTINKLAPKHAQKVVFAMVTASSLAELQAASAKARENYTSYINATTPLLARIPACAGEASDLTPKAGNRYRFFSNINSQAPEAEGETISFITPAKDTTFYAANITNGWPGTLERIEIKVNPAVVAAFSMSAEELLINAGLEETVSFSGTGAEGLSWSWDFGDGQTSSLQNPTIQFSKAGTYQVKLRVASDKGCFLTLSKTLTVHRKEDAPLLSDVLLCLNESALIQEDNGRAMNVYGDAKKETLLYTGTEFYTLPLSDTQNYYVTVGSGLTESDLVMVTATVRKADITITHALAPEVDSPYALKLTAGIEAMHQIDSMIWLDGDVQLGLGESITYTYNAREAAPAIRLHLVFKNGCTQQLLYQLPLTTAPLAQVSDLEICAGEAPLLSPLLEGTYYFYADAALNTLIHKGRSLQLAAVEAPQTLFITNMSGGLESKAVPVHISPSEGLALFNLPANPQTLQWGEASVSFNSSSNNATEWEWNFGDGSTSTAQHPVHAYTRAGIYTITLVAKNSRGCVQSSEQQIEIMAPQAADTKKPARLDLYPNPTKGPITIVAPANIHTNAKLLVMNTSGLVMLEQEVLPAQKIQLDMSAQASGIYLVRIIHENQIWQSRLICQ